MKVLGGTDRPLPPRGGGVGERGGSMPLQRPTGSTDGFGHMVSQEFDEFVCNDGPLSPTPSTAHAASRAGCGGAEQCSAKPRLRHRGGGREKKS